LWARHSTIPFAAKLRNEVAVPNIDWSLLVPSASIGGTPANNRAGIMISPPPPAMASMNPVSTAVAVRAVMIHGSSSRACSRVPNEALGGAPS
jgi:hypothetical protein